MKKLYILLIAWTALLTSCQKEVENAFDKSVDERLQETMDHYKDRLVSSPNGWFLTVGTKAGGTYRFWMSFTEDNRVSMIADYAGAVVMESSYQIRSLLKPMLTFDTANFITELCDPDPKVNGGEAGVGLKSDFEFYFLTEFTGGFALTGRFNGCTARLEPATAAQAEAVFEGGMFDLNNALEAYMSTIACPIITVDNQQMMVTIGTRSTAYSYLDANNNLVTGSVNSYMDMDKLNEPNAYGSIIIIGETIKFAGKQIVRFTWDADKSCYDAVLSNDESYEVTDNMIPPFTMDKVFGDTKSFNYMRTQMPQMAGTLTGKFLELCVEVNMKLAGMSNRSLGYIDMRVYANGASTTPVTYEDAEGNKQTAQDVLEVTFRYLNSTGSGYDAQWYWRINKDANGIYTFTDMQQRLPDRTNENNTKSAYLNVFKFINENQFELDWVTNKTVGSTAIIGGFHVVKDGARTGDFMGGILGKK